MSTVLVLSILRVVLLDFVECLVLLASFLLLFRFYVFPIYHVSESNL